MTGPNSLPQYLPLSSLPSALTSSVWFVDSGATHHVMDNFARLTSVNPYSSQTQLVVGDGVSLPITHIGTLVSSSPSFLLCQILVIPGITKNLLSVSQFALDNHCVYQFNSNSFIATSIKNGQEILRRVLDNRLYCVTLPSYHSSTPFASVVSLTSWHNCFGHATIDRLVRLLNSSNISVSRSLSSVCTTCAMNKNHRHSH